MSGITGLLADYGIDTDEVEAPSYEIEDGIYHFVVGDVFIQHGTKADPDGPDSVVFSFRLSDDEDGLADGREKREWFNLPEDPENPTDDEKQKLGFYKARVMSLGFTATEVNSVTREDLIGITGTLQLAQTAGKGKNKGKTYQNIRNVRVDEGERAEVSAAPEAAEPEEAPAAKAPVAKVASKAKAAPAKPKTAPGNPFA